MMLLQMTHKHHIHLHWRKENVCILKLLVPKTDIPNIYHFTILERNHVGTQCNDDFIKFCKEGILPTYTPQKN